MAIQAGTKLGPYEIQGTLGAGGMGEVYRARDSKLERVVAIKVLGAAYSADQERVHRFEQEARAASALNHPNIVTIYDIGQQDGVSYLAMEYVDGKTVRELLGSGPLALRKALSIAAQAADGLAKAHAAGIVHRDLKPENLMVTNDGVVKVLDFGLAKLVAERSGAAPSGLTATMAAPATHPGVLLGTVGYMSPEQARGAAVDFRSDQFSLGTVLCEMITGKRAFQSESSAQTLAAIIEDEPAGADELNTRSPAPLRWIVERCLAKEADERYASTRDLARDLLRVREHLSDISGGSTASLGVRPAPAVWRRRSHLWLAVLGVLLVVAYGLGRYTAPAPVRPPAYRATLNPPPGHSFTAYELAMSPEGSRVAFTATSKDGITTLWVKSLVTNSDQEFSGTAGASNPFWSPDGKQVGFFAGGKLNRLEVANGSVHTVCEVLLGRGGTWSKEGVILFAPRNGASLMRVPAGGGVPAPATKVHVAQGESHRWPLFLPDGRRFLYTVDYSGSQDGVYAGSLDDDSTKFIGGNIRGNVEYGAGRLLFVRDGSLYAQPFDTARLELQGEPAPIVAQELEQDVSFAKSGFSTGGSGALVYQSRRTYSSRLVWFDRNGKESDSLGEPASYNPTISPNGRWLAVLLDPSNNGHPRVHVIDLVRGSQMPVTPESDRNDAVMWSPDSTSVVYSNRSDRAQLLRKAVDGYRQPEVLLEGNRVMANDWSADGRYILYMGFEKGFSELTSYDLKEKKSAVLEYPGAEGQFSPDGRWVSFTIGGRTSAPQVFIRAFPGPGPRIQVSTTGGSQARWRRDGKELYYIGADKRLMAVPITVRGDSIEAGTPTPLFQTRVHRPLFALFQYAVSADGQRFLISSLPREDAAAPITLITDWTAEIPR